MLFRSSGGGKSTMALELLKNPDYFLLSEDTPFIDRHGRILPFPLRIGVSPGTNTGIPAKFLRTVRRMEFDPKMLIDIEYFSERLGRITKPGLMLVGERNLGTESAIVPISKTKAFKALLKYMVVGLGIYQGLEFLLERGIMEIIGKADVVASRLNNSFKLLSSVNTYKFVLGRNTEKNYETLVAFIDKTLG